MKPINIMKFVELSPVALLLFAVSCTSTVRQNPETESSAVAAQEVKLTKRQFEQSNLEWVNIAQQPLYNTLSVNGRVTVPPAAEANISTYFGGTVKDCNWQIGEKVSAGQVLLRLENPDYVTMQQDYLNASNELTFLTEEYERQKELSLEQIASKKELLRAEANYKNALAKLKALAKQLALMGIAAESLTAENISAEQLIKSPITGVVSAVNVVNGAFLTPGEVALRIINPKDAQLELIAFESDGMSVKAGQRVRFTTQQNEASMEAKIMLKGVSLDQAQNAIGLIAKLTNQEDAMRLVPGMYVQAQIIIDSVPKLCLPADAIVEIGDEYFALLLQSSQNEAFTLKKVELAIGFKTTDQVEIINAGDFDQGSKFLGKGAFRLLQ